MEAGCGIVPITYKEKSFVHALQWAIGWSVSARQRPVARAMSTDHPNGGSSRVSTDCAIADGSHVSTGSAEARPSARASALDA